MADYQQFDSEGSLREAKRRLPLDRLMMQYGDQPPPVGMKWSRCPFCEKKSTARISDSGSQLFFKCANDTCPSQTAGEGNAWTEMHYLSYKHPGLLPRELFVAYLKMTNVWVEREKHSGPAEDRVPPKKEEQPTSNEDDGDTAPQAATGPGTQPVEGVDSAIGQPAESSAGSNPAGAAPSEPVGGTPADDEELIQQCIAVVMMEQRGSVSLLQRRLRLGYGRATRIMEELERRKIVGPSRGAEPREVFVRATPVAKSPEQLLSDDIAAWVDYVSKAEKRLFHFIEIEGMFGFTRAKEVMQAMLDRQVVTARAGGDMYLTPKPAATVEFVSAKTEKAEEVKPGKIDGEDGYAALHDFFVQLPFFERDGKILFERRGLKTSTCEGLRFRSNPRTNRGVLLGQKPRIAKDELLDSGLHVRVKGKHADIKPNSQFCGAGIIRKLKEGEKPDRNQWVDNDGNLWGWCEPILIPYFDEKGRIIGLRPHKGGGQANTVTGQPRIYVPRALKADGKPASENFPKVIITEGEFKAAALWQTVGAGRIDGKEPYGVVALPGIWFGQNYAIREELDQWLKDVRCRVVKVAYDNEDKSNPQLASFKTDRRKRFDAEICARVLANDIANKVHVRGEVCRLPDTWRNDKGKADWDGALVMLTQKR